MRLEIASFSLQVLEKSLGLIGAGAFRTLRDVYYMHPELFGLQLSVNEAVNDMSVYFRLPRSSMHIV